MRILVPLLLLPACLLLVASAAEAEDALPLEARVNAAIDRSAANLVKRQAADGSWQADDKVHPLGRTALCAFALLHAGYPPDHSSVRKALAFLGLAERYGGAAKMPRSTYEAACLVLFLNALGDRHAGTIRRICAWLCESFNANVGLWGYPDGTPDLSNTQYAALALKAGARHGFEAPKSIWKRLLDSVIRLQAEDGAFRYRSGTMYRASMTHAGLLVLRFAQEGLRLKRAPRRVRQAEQAGHRWLEEHYDVERAPFGRGWHLGHYYYYLYGLERYAVFFERESIDGHDWYREGAEALLDRQKDDGSWGTLEDTSFAILFLRRATLTPPDVREGAGAGSEEAAGADEPASPPLLRPDPSVPSLREWLLAGPFPGGREEDDHLFLSHVDPRRVKPRPGGAAGKERWQRHDSPTDRIELGQVLGAEPWASFYAAAWLHVEADAKGAVLWIGSDDGLRVWLDGTEVLYGHHHDHSGDDHYRVPLSLAAGRHLLLVQVENLEYYVHFRARLSDPRGLPLAGVLATAAPRLRGSPGGR